MASVLTGKEIFLRILESINGTTNYYNPNNVDCALNQYNKLRELDMFKNYPKITRVK